MKNKEISKASISSLISNIFLLIIKSIIALITNSQAMLADAINSATDIFSSIMTYIGNKISSLPKNEDYNLGHGKAEYIYALLISIMMCLISLYILKKSLTSFNIYNNYTFSIWLIIVCIVTIIIKSNLYIYINNISKKYNNLLLEATAKDHRNDCLLTTLTLIASILSIKKIYFFDNIASFIIALFIFISALKIFKKSYDVLMDKALNKKTKRAIFKTIHKHSEVLKITNFTSSPIGYQYQVSFTIHIDGYLSNFESHKITTIIEKEIKKNFPEVYLITIQVKPVYIIKNKRLRRKIHKKKQERR